jgi:hypothetical protein
MDRVSIEHGIKSDNDHHERGTAQHCALKEGYSKLLSPRLLWAFYHTNHRRLVPPHHPVTI